VVARGSVPRGGRALFGRRCRRASAEIEGSDQGHQDRTHADHGNGRLAWDPLSTGAFVSGKVTFGLGPKVPTPAAPDELRVAHADHGSLAAPALPRLPEASQGFVMGSTPMTQSAVPQCTKRNWCSPSSVITTSSRSPESMKASL